MAGNSPKPTPSAVNRRGVNHLLSLLPRAERERVVARCDKRSFELGQPIYGAGARIEQVYFPLSGMISFVLGTEQGGSIEVGAVGNEGFAGSPLALGSDRSDVHAMVQLEGEFLCMRAGDFRLELGRGAALAGLVQRGVQVMFTQIARSVMCNRLHSVEERTCRWLLMTHDRAGGGEMQLTQQFIAEMLGIRRASVTLAAGLLQKAGFIRYSRGKVTVLDRAGLEKTACECYLKVRREAERLLAPTRR